MPKILEEKLKRQAKKKFKSTTSKKARAYIYGSMQKITDWKPKRKKK